MQVFLILFSDYFTVFQLLKLFSYIELTLIRAVIRGPQSVDNPTTHFY